MGNSIYTNICGVSQAIMEQNGDTGQNRQRQEVEIWFDWWWVCKNRSELQGLESQNRKNCEMRKDCSTSENNLSKIHILPTFTIPTKSPPAYAASVYSEKDV